MRVLLDIVLGNPEAGERSLFIHLTGKIVLVTLISLFIWATQNKDVAVVYQIF